MTNKNNFNTLFNTLQHSGTPFVLYRLPNSNVLILQEQRNTKHYQTATLQEEGFVFAPFKHVNKYTYIPNHKRRELKIPKQTLKNSNQSQSESTQQKTYYTDLVAKAKAAIAQGDMQKVVVSRIHKHPYEENLAASFVRLLHAYPNAMVYFWSHPHTGSWMGVTPETLVTVKNQNCKTMALAGTLAYQEAHAPKWSIKEQDEQQMVTDFIQQQLSKLYPHQNIAPSTAYSKRAGNLVHLCADFNFTIGNVSLLNLIRALHPTPAVSGVPVAKSMVFLELTETHERKYYAGFLGPIEKDRAHICVNLRCAEVTPHHLTLYVGGGITAESDIVAEWEESQRKAETLLNVI